MAFCNCNTFCYLLNAHVDAFDMFLLFGLTKKKGGKKILFTLCLFEQGFKDLMKNVFYGFCAVHLILRLNYLPIRFRKEIHLSFRNFSSAHLINSVAGPLKRHRLPYHFHRLLLFFISGIYVDYFIFRQTEQKKKIVGKNMK